MKQLFLCSPSIVVRCQNQVAPASTTWHSSTLICFQGHPMKSHFQSPSPSSPQNLCWKKLPLHKWIVIKLDSNIETSLVHLVHLINYHNKTRTSYSDTCTYMYGPLKLANSYPTPERKIQTRQMKRPKIMTVCVVLPEDFNEVRVQSQEDKDLKENRKRNTDQELMYLPSILEICFFNFFSHPLQSSDTLRTTTCSKIQ